MLLGAPALPFAVETDTSAADTAWQNITAPLDGLDPKTAYKKFAADPLAYGTWRNRWAKQYRERGLAFWEQFPNDDRRWDWFWIASTRDSTRVTYALDPKLSAWNYTFAHWGENAFAIDHEAQQEWEAKYLLIRPQYLALTDHRWTQNHATFLWEELYQRLWRAGEAAARGETVDRYGLTIDYENFISRSDVADDKAIWMAQAFLSSDLLRGEWGLQRAFIGAMRLSTRSEMREIAEGEANVLNLLDRPIDLRLPLLVGEGQMDLAKLRGHVVLVDFYSLYCSGCWAKMPVLHALHERYHSAGLEIVGVCASYGENEKMMGMNFAQRQQAVIDRLKKQDAQWTNAYMSGTVETALRTQYALYGMPRTYLFDQSGKLVTKGGGGWDLEKHIRKLLKLPDLRPGEEIHPAGYATP